MRLTLSISTRRLNILIAVVNQSYADEMKRGKQLFWQSRTALVMEWLLVFRRDFEERTTISAKLARLLHYGRWWRVADPARATELLKKRVAYSFLKAELEKDDGDSEKDELVRLWKQQNTTLQAIVTKLNELSLDMRNLREARAPETGTGEQKN